MAPTPLPSMSSTDVDTAATLAGYPTVLLMMRSGMTRRSRFGHPLVTIDARPGTVA